MVDSEAIKKAVTQMAIQAATVAVMALREAHTRHTTFASITNVGEVKRHNHGRPALRQQSFNWNASDKYVGL